MEKEQKQKDAAKPTFTSHHYLSLIACHQKTFAQQPSNTPVSQIQQLQQQKQFGERIDLEAKVAISTRSTSFFDKTETKKILDQCCSG